MISVLYVDDEQNLLDLGKIFLERCGQFSIDIITSAPAALSRLQSKNYDAILSDYQMPEMDGIELLKQIRLSGNTVPFILFTGRGREEVVIQALNEGADFYLQKGGDPNAQFAELSSKIRQAVQRRRAEKSIRDHERRERDIINFLPDATLAIDTKGIVIAWNRAIEEMTGIPASQMLGNGDYEYALPLYGERRPILIDLILSPSDEIREKYSIFVQDGSTLAAETTLPRLRGEQRTLWGKASLLYDQGGKVVGAIESIRDITEQKTAEKKLRAAYEQLTSSEEKFRRIVDTSNEGILQVDEKLEITYVNRRLMEILGYTPEEITGSNFISFIPDEAVPDQNCQVEERRQGKCGRYERRLITKDGQERWWQVSATPIMAEDGTFGGSFAMLSDITEQKAAEIALRTSQNMLMAALDLAHLATWEFDCKTGMFTFDDRFYALFGTTAAREGGYQMPADVYFREFVHPDDRDRIMGEMEQYKRISDPSFISQQEHRIIRRDGGVRHIIVRAERITDNDGQKIKIRGVNQDITERKIAEDELRQKNEELRSTYEQLAAAEEELRSQYDELARNEKRIRESEEKYRELVENANSIILKWDKAGTITFVNEYAERFFGYPRDEMIGKSVMETIVPAREIASEKDPEPMIEDIIRHPGNYVANENENVTRDGGHVWIRWTNKPFFDEKGEVAGLISIGTDITERKAAETELKQSEEMYRVLVDHIQDGAFLIQDDTLLLGNEIAASMLGYSPSEITGMPVHTFIAPEDREMVMEGIRIRLSGKSLQESYEFRLLHKDGTTRIPVIMSVGMSISRNRPAFVGTVRSIVTE